VQSEKLPSLRNTTFDIISNCCVAKHLPTKSSLTKKRKGLPDIPVPSPLLEWSSSATIEENDVSPAMSLVSRLLGGSSAFDCQDKSSTNRIKLMKRNADTLESQLQAFTRLLLLCELSIDEGVASDFEFVTNMLGFLADDQGILCFAQHTEAHQEQVIRTALRVNQYFQETASLSIEQTIPREVGCEIE
jgi:hypothetical protein